MFTKLFKDVKVRAVVLIGVFVLSSASACIIKDDNGGEAIHIDPPRLMCDEKCGCATDGEASGWAYCMANK